MHRYIKSYVRQRQDYDHSIWQYISQCFYPAKRSAYASTKTQVIYLLLLPSALWPSYLKSGGWLERGLARSPPSWPVTRSWIPISGVVCGLFRVLGSWGGLLEELKKRGGVCVCPFRGLGGDGVNHDTVRSTHRRFGGDWGVDSIYRMWCCGESSKVCSVWSMGFCTLSGLCHNRAL
jgi:hypothetical protein